MLKDSFVWRFKFSLFSLGLSALAGINYLDAVSKYEQHDWRPIEKPIGAINEAVAAEFTADLDNNYQIVGFNNNIDGDYWECVFGTTFLAERCAVGNDSISTQWRITSRGSVVSEGSAEGPGRFGYYRQGESGSRVTWIDATSGQSFQVEVTLRGTSKPITLAKPRLEVLANPLAHKEAFISRSIWHTIVLFCVIVTVAIFALEMFLAWRYNKARHGSADQSDR